jgi:peptide/nickel transport system substrate-binding protein
VCRRAVSAIVVLAALGATGEAKTLRWMLSNLAATRSEGLLDGAWNEGGCSNPFFDQLIKKIQVELDSEKRNELISKGLSMVKENFAYLPLHQHMVVWASRDNVELPPMGNNDFQLRYVKLK